MQVQRKSLESLNDGGLTFRVDETSISARRNKNDLCIYDTKLPKVQRKNPYRNRKGRKADEMKKHYLAKVKVAGAGISKSNDSNIIIDGTVDMDNLELDFAGSRPDEDENSNFSF